MDVSTNGQNIFIEQIVTKIIERTIDPFIGYIGMTAQKEYHKNSITNQKAYVTYVRNTLNKYAYVKTLIDIHTPTNLYDFFECNRLSFAKTSIIDSPTVNNVFQKTNFNVITGIGGIGKTTLLKHFFVDALQNTTKIPVFIELRHVDNEKTLQNTIYNELCKFGFKLDKDMHEYAMLKGAYCILMDGLDEVQLNTEMSVRKQLNELADRYPDNLFCVTSRPLDDFVWMQRFTVLHLMPFVKEQAMRMIKKIKYDEVIKSSFISELDKNLYSEHQSFAENPLLLTIMLLTYTNYAQVPNKIHTFYSQAFDTLYYRHDATKDVYKRVHRSELSYDNFKRLFASLSIKATKHEIYEFDKSDLIDILNKSSEDMGICVDADNYVYDLVNAVCLLYYEGRMLRFTHRSFKEYFSAIHINELVDEYYQTIVWSFLSWGMNLKSGDMILPILYDLNPDRFEQIVLCPIFQDINENRQHGRSLYNVYFEFFCKAGVKIYKTESEVRIAIAEPQDSDYSSAAIMKVLFSIEKLSLDNRVFDNKFINSYCSKESCYYTYNEIVNSSEKFNDFRKTWIGILIREIVEYSDYVISKSRSYRATYNEDEKYDIENGFFSKLARKRV